MNKKLCNCGEIATWLYMPSSRRRNPFNCDNCVSRGCDCNNHYIVNDWEKLPTEEDGIEGEDWKWIEKNLEWTPLDALGREWPCCEYDNDENGFLIEG